MSSKDKDDFDNNSTLRKFKKVDSAHGTEQQLSSRHDHRADEVQEYSVVLMGLTGSGKSAFISALIGRDIGIGRDLKSCTSEADQYEIELDRKTMVHLIDTPGFDDTDMNDSDVLKKIAFFLSTMYQEEYPIHGVIFLHRITDQRVTGSSLKNLRILEKICGKSAFAHISLVSTMWDLLQDRAQGISRENELMNNAKFWAPFIEGHSVIARHDGTLLSARRIVQNALGRGTVVLQLQRELVDEDRDLAATSAGSFLQGDLRATRHKHEQELKELEEALEEAREDGDAELLHPLSEQRDKLVLLLSRHDVQQHELRISAKSLAYQRKMMLSELKAETERNNRVKEEEVKALRKQIQMLENGLADTNTNGSRLLDQVLKDREALARHNTQMQEQASARQKETESRLAEVKRELAVKDSQLTRALQPGNMIINGVKSLFRSAFKLDQRQIYIIPKTRGSVPQTLRSPDGQVLEDHWQDEQSLHAQQQWIDHYQHQEYYRQFDQVQSHYADQVPQESASSYAETEVSEEDNC